MGDTILKEALSCKPVQSKKQPGAAEELGRLHAPPHPLPERARRKQRRTDGWLGVLPTDLSGQHLLSSMGCGPRRFRKHCNYPITELWAEGGVEIAASPAAGTQQQLGRLGSPFSGPLPSSPTGDISLGPAASRRPREPPQILRDSCGSGWENVAGPTGSGPRLAPLRCCTLAAQSRPGRLCGRPPGDPKTGLRRAKRPVRVWVVSRVNILQ